MNKYLHYSTPNCLPLTQTFFFSLCT